jgi:hypothetical protein
MNCSVDALVTAVPDRLRLGPVDGDDGPGQHPHVSAQDTLRAGAAELPVRRREADRGSAQRHRQVVQRGLPGSHGVIVASEALKGR